MLSAKDIGGLMGMMPAFATDNAGDFRARDTVDVDRLHKGVDRAIRDGMNVIATTGSFGECHTLTTDEFRVLAHETTAAVKKRIPLFIGTTAPNTREAVDKMRIVEETGADGVLVGVPYYFPSSLDNAINFYREIGETFPTLNILIYHNPALHHVRLPIDAFKEITRNPAVVGMKDSHREPLEMARLCKLTAGRMSLMVNQAQYFSYADFGAAGFWSIDAWMGPWPQLALRDAVARGDRAAAAEITADFAPPSAGGPPNLQWRETGSKIAVRMAGYVDPGPLRPPFVKVPDSVLETQKKKVERWRALCDKYRPATQTVRAAE
jgi:hydratase-aldolase